MIVDHFCQSLAACKQACIHTLIDQFAQYIDVPGYMINKLHHFYIQIYLFGSPFKTRFNTESGI